jgi:hypothetical protein
MHCSLNNEGAIKGSAWGLREDTRTMDLTNTNQEWYPVADFWVPHNGC